MVEGTSMEIWITPEKAAAMLNVQPQTLKRYAERQELSTQRTPGGHRRYNLAEIEAFATRLRKVSTTVTVISGGPTSIEAP
jgi:excisionase family DNA binding protein